jgi:hypothetical protein
VADAEVIPIGSGGRPGRGSGRRTTPSAAARALAGPGAGRSSSKKKPAAKPAAEVPVEPVVDDVPAVEAAAGLDFAGLERVVRELFGEEGERRVAEWLAFLRRRLSGEYEVDEFGYDSDLTDQMLLPLLRPMAEKWFRVEVRGVENIPDTGGALIRREPLRHDAAGRARHPVDHRGPRAPAAADSRGRPGVPDAVRG